MSDSTQPRAVLWLPDPAAPAGWGRKPVWSEPERKPAPRREMGFHAEVERSHNRDEREED